MNRLNFFSYLAIPLLFLLSLWANPRVVVAEEILQRDMAVLRVGKKIFFYSDLKDLEKNLSSFLCLYPSSLLTAVTELNQEKLKKVQWVNLKEKNEPQKYFPKQEILSSFVALLKVEQYLSSQARPDKAPKIETSKSKLQKCGFGKDISLAIKTLRSFILIESFLKGRYAHDSFWLKDGEKKELRGEKVKEDFSRLIQILDRQIAHDYFRSSFNT